MTVSRDAHVTATRRVPERLERVAVSAPSGHLGGYGRLHDVDRPAPGSTSTMRRPARASRTVRSAIASRVTCRAMGSRSWSPLERERRSRRDLRRPA
jgi:hypothetical protein